MLARSLRSALFVLVALAVLAGVGCSSQQGAAPAEPIPASSPLSQIQEGMTDDQVQSILGAPDHSHNYISGKSWIPFYYGPDTSRMEWRYTGQGLITFSRNQYSGTLKVIRVIYNPNQTAN